MPEQEEGGRSQLKLEFENAQFLSSLFANDPRELRYLETRLAIDVVTRDGWILLAGDGKDLEIARGIFGELEEARRAGTEVTRRDFRFAVDLALGEGEVGFSEIASVRLLGSRTRRAVCPRTRNQFDYLKAMQAEPLVFGLGPAGTGKTYLAMAMALAMLKAGTVNRVVLARPAVEAGEALGFLPGDLREKVAPYLRPLYDALHDMVEPEEGTRYLEDGTIEIAPLAYMRGRTLAHSFVILDEAQNTTREQMFMFLTRIGEGSCCVVTGDNSQTDLGRGVPSGLEEATRSLQGVEGAAFITFDPADVVRHPIVSRIIQAYDKVRKVRED